MRSKKLTHAIFKTVRSLGRSPEDVEDFKNYLRALESTYFVFFRSQISPKTNQIEGA
jgi:hypothetical protein